MKSVAGPLVAAIVLALAGGAFWLVGQTETRIADMHKQLAMLHYDEAGQRRRGGRAVARPGAPGAAWSGPPPKPTCATRARPPATGARTTRRIAPQRDANGVVTETDPAILFLSANAGVPREPARDRPRRRRPAARQRRQELRRGAEDRGSDVRHRRAGVRDAGDGRGLQLRVRDPRARGAGPQPRRRRREERGGADGAERRRRRRGRSAVGADAARTARAARRRQPT